MDKIALARLNQLRKEHNETFKMLEESVGISDSTLSAWYSGKAEPSTYGLEKLAAHYHLTVSQLYASVPLSTVPLDKQQDMDIVLRIIDECNADKSFQAHHCQTVIDHQKELRRMDQERHETLFAQQKDAYETLIRQKDAHHASYVNHLMDQIRRLRLSAIIFSALLVLVLVIDSPNLGALSTVGDDSLLPLRAATLCLLLLLLALAGWSLFPSLKARKMTKPNPDK